jgi:hypothetical protein
MGVVVADLDVFVRQRRADEDRPLGPGHSTLLVDPHPAIPRRVAVHAHQRSRIATKSLLFKHRRRRFLAERFVSPHVLVLAPNEIESALFRAWVRAGFVVSAFGVR